MALVQTYETTISMADGSLAVSCLIVPHRSADVNGVELSARETRNMFAATISIPIDPSSLPNALASILVAQKQGVDVIETYIRLNKSGFVDWEIEIEKLLGKDSISFLNEISFTDIIPFEQSPLASASLAGLMTKAKGIGLGAL